MRPWHDSNAAHYEQISRIALFHSAQIARRLSTTGAPTAFWAAVQESLTRRSGTYQLHMPTGRGDKHFEVVTVHCDDLVAVHGYERQSPVDHVRCPGPG